MNSVLVPLKIPEIPKIPKLSWKILTNTKIFSISFIYLLNSRKMCSKGSGLVLIFFMRNLFRHIFCFSQLNFYLDILKYPILPSFFHAVSIKISLKREIILNLSKYKRISKKSENPGKFHWNLLYKETFKKYVHSKFPSFDPLPPPLVRPCLLLSTPAP